MKGNKVFDFWFRKQYVIAGCLVLCAAFGMTALYNYNQEQERKQLEQQIAENEAEQYVVEETQMESVSSVVPPKSNSAENAVEDVNEMASVEGILGAEEYADLLEEQIETVPEPVQEVPVEEVAATVPSLHFPVEEGLLWPMDGNVIMNYSMDATIYHATLDQYKCNPAIIIAGAVNNKVFSVSKGQVVDISQNEVTGMTMTVDLGDGYRAIYGQIKEPNFKVGDYVESGHVLGYVSEPTKYYAIEGSNLYFELQKDGEPVDPILYFE